MDPQESHRVVHPSSGYEVCRCPSQVRTLVAEQRPFKGVENYFTDALLYQDAHEVVAQQKNEFELGNKADRESIFESNNKSKEWELNLQALEALEMSEQSTQTAATEGESDSDWAWKFDASALKCLKTVAIDSLGLDKYRPAYFDYSFKEEAAESLLVSIL